ncbi:MAG TPA: DUF1062 domain-containing protein [Clostridia bacterium]|nr:DUF1062 domain-containing protein [Clostridia bacterium]
MNTITWEVNFLSPPKVTRHCAGCGARTEHIPSGLFRVNAQQKRLDIWLVYRCARCKGTWNLAILSRVSPAGVGRELLERYTENDASLALGCAMDENLLARAGADTEPPAYEINGEPFDPALESLLTITSPYPSRLRVAKLIREKLGLSRKDFEALCAARYIKMENGTDLSRARLNREAVVRFGARAADE